MKKEDKEKVPTTNRIFQKKLYFPIFCSEGYQVLLIVTISEILFFIHHSPAQSGGKTIFSTFSF